jgi:hypothetical protein
MRRTIAFVGLAFLAAGCGGSPSADGTASVSATGKPTDDEAKACIVAYFSQCGWQDVQLVRMADHAEIPKGAKVTGEVWAYTFSATYTNVVGEKVTSENWVAVVARADGKPCVKGCFDETRRMVGGHSGDELAEKGILIPQPPAADAPAIIAPKP